MGGWVALGWKTRTQGFKKHVLWFWLRFLDGGCHMPILPYASQFPCIFASLWWFSWYSRLYGDWERLWWPFLLRWQNGKETMRESQKKMHHMILKGIPKTTAEPRVVVPMGQGRGVESRGGRIRYLILSVVWMPICDCNLMAISWQSHFVSTSRIKFNSIQFNEILFLGLILPPNASNGYSCH